MKTLLGLMVATDVFPDFGFPELRVGSRQAASRAVVAVPKATVYEDRRRVLREHDIGFARQIFAVEPKSEALGV